MDGTLVDSTDGVVGAWELFAEKYPGLDVTQVLSCTYLASMNESSQTKEPYVMPQPRTESVQWRT